MSVNTYKCEPQYDADLIVGPDNLGQWSGFHPVIAEFLTDDLQRVSMLKKQIAPDAWLRCQTMATQYMDRHPNVARDGRPVYAGLPANIRA